MKQAHKHLMRNLWLVATTRDDSLVVTLDQNDCQFIIGNFALFMKRYNDMQEVLK